MQERLATATGVDLREANVSEAKLDRANLSGGDIARANFSRADLTGVQFSSTRISETVFTGAILANLRARRVLEGGKYPPEIGEPGVGDGDGVPKPLLPRL